MMWRVNSSNIQFTKITLYQTNVPLHQSIQFVAIDTELYGIPYRGHLFGGVWSSSYRIEIGNAESGIWNPKSESAGIQNLEIQFHS